MAITTTFDFNDPGSYNYDPLCIEVSAGARLILADNPNQTFNQDFSSDSGFTYDSSKVSFSSGTMSQTAQNPADSSIGVNYNSSVDANWNIDGSVLATLTGGASLTSGKLDCRGNSNDGAYYTRSISPEGAIRFRYTPNYNVPGTNTNMVALSRNFSTFNRMVFFNSPSGGSNLRVTLYDDAGTLVASAAVIAGVSWTLGQEYEMEFNWNSSTGIINAFQDGVLLGSINVGSWNRSSETGRTVIGAFQGLYNSANAEYDDVIVFNTVQHTSSYTPGYTIPDTLYSETTVDLPQFSYTGVGAIQSFTDLEDVNASGVQYTLNGLYYNGSIWVASDGSFAQSNDKATVVTNLGSLPQSDTLDVQVVWDDTNTQGTIDDLTITYTGQIYNSGCSIKPNNFIAATSITSFSSDQTEDKPFSTVKYTYQIGSTEYYHNGTAWVSSSGIEAETNTSEEINNNLSSLPIDSNGSATRFVAYFFTDGTFTEELNSVTVEFVYDVDNINCPDKTVIFVDSSISNCDTPNVTLRAVTEDQFFLEDNNIIPNTLTASSNAEGIAFLEIIITGGKNDYKYHWYVDFFDSEGNAQTIDYGYAATPNQLATNLADLTFTDTQ